MAESNVCRSCLSTIQTINPELSLCKYCIDTEYKQINKYFMNSLKLALIILAIVWVIIRILEVHPDLMVILPLYIKLSIYLVCLLAPFGQPYIRTILGGSFISLPVEVLILFDIFLSVIAAIAAPKIVLERYKAIKVLKPHLST